MNHDAIFLYGPSGAGKSSAGKILAASLDLPFHDLDAEIEVEAGRSIPEIFKSEGESGFRTREKKALQAVVNHHPIGVVALGGGALLAEDCRAIAEAHGCVIVLRAENARLAQRLQADTNERPLLAENVEEKLKNLLAKRAEHYNSFATQMDTTTHTPAQTAWQIQILLGWYHIQKMGAYDILIRDGGLDHLGQWMAERGLKGPLALVCDSHTGPLYAARAEVSLMNAGYTVHKVEIPAGELHKNIQTITHLWDAFLQAGLERGSTVVALGGGVVTDMVGFAAATYLRGIKWAAVPTTLLAMADASLGGKTGIDLPQGKNLAGAFHPPSLVLADPQVLRTLPAGELNSGMGEVLKHGLIADPLLWQACVKLSPPSQWEQAWPDLNEIVRRAVAVKVEVIEQDPLEKGWRAVLNYGHTIGHAIETVSNYTLRHGECVAIGMVIEARISEALGLAQPGLADEISVGLKKLGLPWFVPEGLDQSAILGAIGYDKKKSAGQVLFALPVKIGEAKIGIQVDEKRRKDALISGIARS